MKELHAFSRALFILDYIQYGAAETRQQDSLLKNYSSYHRIKHIVITIIRIIIAVIGITYISHYGSSQFLFIFSIIPTFTPVVEASPWRFVPDQEELSLQRQSRLHSSARTLNYPNPYMTLYVPV